MKNSGQSRLRTPVVESVAQLENDFRLILRLFTVDALEGLVEGGRGCSSVKVNKRGQRLVM